MPAQAPGGETAQLPDFGSGDALFQTGGETVRPAGGAFTGTEISASIGQPDGNGAAPRLGFVPVDEIPPSSGAVVMPKFNVDDSRIHITEDEIRSPGQVLADAKKQYISPLYSVTFGPLAQLAAYYFNFPSILGGWHPNDVEARTLYEQDRRLRKMNEFDDWMDQTALVDPAEAKALRRMRAELFRLP